MEACSIVTLLSYCVNKLGKSSISKLFSNPAGPCSFVPFCRALLAFSGCLFLVGVVHIQHLPRLMVITILAAQYSCLICISTSVAVSLISSCFEDQQSKHFSVFSISYAHGYTLQVCYWGSHFAPPSAFLHFAFNSQCITAVPGVCVADICQAAVPGLL